MLQWPRIALAEKSQVSERTIINFERGARAPRPIRSWRSGRPLRKQASPLSMRTAADRVSGCETEERLADLIAQ